jgi:hypothetical protein
MFMSVCLHRLTAVFIALALAAPPVTLTVRSGGPPVAQLVKNAACDHNNGQNNPNHNGARQRTNVDCDNTYELKGFLDAVDGIVDPAIIGAMALIPFVLIAGMVSLMVTGGRGRGMALICSGLGAPIFLVSINGLIA